MPVETEQRVFVKFFTNTQKDTEYLVIIRGPGGNNPGQYGLPGGHLNEGESLEEGARRECYEELGVDIDFAACARQATHVYGKRAILSVRCAKQFSHSFQPSPDEVASFQWMSLEAIESIPAEMRHKSLSVAFF